MCCTHLPGDSAMACRARVLVVQQSTGNAAKAGIQAGDTIIYTSSFFGDELWPADKLGFANSAINACPSPVAFVYIKVRPLDQTFLLLHAAGAAALVGEPTCTAVRVLLRHLPAWDHLQGSPPSRVALMRALAAAQGENTEVNVKRLPKKPTPPRFGRKLTAQQRERATHICLDCGYIYCDQCDPPSHARCQKYIMTPKQF